MLELNKPTNKTNVREKVGSYIYDYYWFVLEGSSSDFDYQLSLKTFGKTTENNPDLFVSLKDGRFPSEEDNDYASTLQGADFIRISTNDDVWKAKNYMKTQSTLVVVSVRRRS